MHASTAPIIDLAAGPTALQKALFTDMALIRVVEQTLLDLFSQGRLRGTVHTCLGQEAVAAGVIAAVDKDLDVVCSNHRGHGHYLAYCGDIQGLIAEIMGQAGGVCGGHGGSQHLQRNNFYSNGILGGMAPVAAGIAFAEKACESGAVVVDFHGDGAMSEGAIYETLNIAALWKLPLLFAIESNKYAQSTPIDLEIAGSLSRRAAAFDVPAYDIDGNDALAVHDAASTAIHKIRRGEGPQMLVLDTYRLGPHSKGDDDRDPGEIETHRANCPLERMRLALDEDWCDTVVANATSKVAAVVDNLTTS